MPELARVVNKYSENVGFIGLLDDYSSNLEEARGIAESAGVPESFIMIDARTDGLEQLQQAVSSGYIPTSLIFDGKEQFWTDQIVGSEDGLFDFLLEELLKR